MKASINGHEGSYHPHLLNNSLFNYLNSSVLTITKTSTLRYTRYILKLALRIPMLPRTCPLVVQLYEPPHS